MHFLAPRSTIVTIPLTGTAGGAAAKRAAGLARTGAGNSKGRRLFYDIPFSFTLSMFR
jgi:hypothetical protein